MTRVKIQSIIEHLDHDMQRALVDAVSHVYPDVKINRAALYRAFTRAVGRQCSTWVPVREQHVETKCHHCGNKT